MHTNSQSPGQSDKSSARDLETHAIQFQSHTQNIGCVADAISVIAELNANHADDKEA